MARMPKCLHLSQISGKTSLCDYHHMNSPQSILVGTAIKQQRVLIHIEAWLALMKVACSFKVLPLFPRLHLNVHPCVEVYMANATPEIPLI